MTDQSPNDLFHASSFMQGHNAEYLEQMYARYAADPNAVDDAWAEFFRQLGDAEADVRKEASGPSWARADWPPAPEDDLTGALTGEWPMPAVPAEAFLFLKDNSAGQATCLVVSEEPTMNADFAKVLLDDLHTDNGLSRAEGVVERTRIRVHIALNDFEKQVGMTLPFRMTASFVTH